MSPILKRLCISSVLAAASASSGLAFANDVQLTEIEAINDGTNNGIYIRGVFTPALPCATQGFFLISSDPFEKETVAMLLTAKATGRNVGFTFVYCHANGYGRGNGYVLK